MAKLIKDFTCAPKGYDTTTFRAGEEVTGVVAKWAIEMGYAETFENKVIEVTEKKVTKRRGRPKKVVTDAEKSE